MKGCTPGDARNALGFADQMKVADRLRAMKAEVQSGKHTTAELVAMLSADLELSLTAGNLRTVASGCGVELPKKYATGSGGVRAAKFAALEQRLADAVLRLDKVHSLLLGLTSRVRRLETELGVDRPALTAVLDAE